MMMMMIVLLWICCVWIIRGVEGSLFVFENGYLSRQVGLLSLPASFGMDLGTKEKHYKANLFVAPVEDPYLCQSTSRLRNLANHNSNNIFGSSSGDDIEDKNIYENWKDETVQEKLQDFRLDIALLVKRGICTFEEKARNAQAWNAELEKNSSIQKQYRIKYVVVYNNDSKRDSRDKLVKMQPKGNADDINDIGLLFVSSNSGYYLLSQMTRAQNQLEENNANLPYRALSTDHLLRNTDWLFPVFLDGQTQNLPPDGFEDPPKQPRNRIFNFYDALRYALISLLVLVPLCRTMYLWYVGGGRIRWKRHPTTHRITGIHIIWPRDRWLCAPYRRRSLWHHHGQPNNNNNTAGGGDSSSPSLRKLTSQQVLSLPEIVYQPPSSSDPESSTSQQPTHPPSSTDTNPSISTTTVPSTHTDNNNNKPTTNLSTIDHPERTNMEDNTIVPQPPQTTTQCPSIIVANNDDIDNSALTTTTQDRDNDVTTYSNICSICIEDFEPGEKLRLLPLCGHVFHTDCIMPWLTERSGSCPLCKRLVIENHHANNNDPTNTNTADSDNHSTTT